MEKSPYAIHGHLLVSKNISAIPIKPGSKQPGGYDEVNKRWQGLSGWDRYTRRLPNDVELEKWVRVPNAGIGVCLGEISGIIALDLDYGEQFHRVIESYVPESPVKKKGHKGYTAFYRYNGESNATWRLKSTQQPIVEVLSTGKQTVIPPTLHPETGLPYEWLTPRTLVDLSVADLPYLCSFDVLDNILGDYDIVRSGATGDKPTIERVNDSWDVDDIKKALEHIDPDICHEDWVKIGMGLHSSLGASGLSIWTEWSSKGQKFKAGETEKRWESFHATPGGVTARFLFELAKQAGYKRQPSYDWNKVEDDDFISLWPDEDKLNYAGSVLKGSEKKSNVVSLDAFRDLDATAFMTALVASASADDERTAQLESISKLCQLVAKSNGLHDGWAIDEMKKRWDWITFADKKNFASTIKKQRKDLQGRARRQERRERQDDEPAHAVAQDYYNMFDALYKTAAKDIFSEEVLYFDDTARVWKKVSNRVREIRAAFLTRQQDEPEIRYTKGDIEDYLYAWMDNKQPRLVVDIPEWDGRQRIVELAGLLRLDESYMQQYEITDQDVFEYLRDWHARMWCRMWDPGSFISQNRLLLLVGPQGLGKDVWIQHNIGALGQFAPNMTIYPHSERDTRAQLHTGLVMNISEFDRSAAMHASSLKALITDQSTNVRTAYSRSEEFRPVRCSFVSSCNRRVQDLLRDWTGNRRFIPVEIAGIEWITTDDDYKLQVLAEGRHWAKERIFASDEANAKLSAYLDAQRPDSPEDVVCDVFDEVMQSLVETLLDNASINSRPVDQWLKASEKSIYDGFIPNSCISDHNVMETVTRRIGWRPSKVRELLARLRSHKNEAGKIIKKRVGGVSTRGLYFKLDNELEDKLVPTDVPF